MDASTMKEIAALWDALNETNKKLSDFVDAVHATSVNGIGENSDGILDIADVVDSLDTRVTALEEK